MATKSVQYTLEFKRQMVDLVRSGRTHASLAKEFGQTPWSISLWVKQDARDAGDGGLTSAEREELLKLRRENRRLKEEREILSKATARMSGLIRFHESEERFEVLLSVANQAHERAGTEGCGLRARSKRFIGARVVCMARRTYTQSWLTITISAWDASGWRD
jgi:transposase